MQGRRSIQNSREARLSVHKVKKNHVIVGKSKWLQPGLRNIPLHIENTTSNVVFLWPRAFFRFRIFLGSRNDRLLSSYFIFVLCHILLQLFILHIMIQYFYLILTYILKLIHALYFEKVFTSLNIYIELN